MNRPFFFSTRKILSRWIAVWVAFCFLLWGNGGCSSKIVDLSRVKDHPELLPERTVPFGNLKETPATTVTIRERGLNEGRWTPFEKLARLQEEANRQPSVEVLAAFCELGYDEAVRQEKENPDQAGEIYIAVILNSYRFLFDPIFEKERNPFDAKYQAAARYYNRATERLLRMIARHQKNNGALPLAPGNDVNVVINDQTWTIRCVLAESAWQSEEIGEIQFASDYKVDGLATHYEQEGLGVPIIVTRCRADRNEEIYYPSDLSFPMTLFLRPNPKGGTPIVGDSTQKLEPQVVLEFHDPLIQKTTTVGKNRVPLAVDLTTPLAYNFIDPFSNEIGTLGLTHPEKFFEPLSDEKNMGRTLAGFYMLAPYNPDKIPVVMIHGLWSTPMTWLAMIGAFQNDPEIWDHYQFWFWCYPTGLPWWVSAAGLRHDLEEFRLTVDPRKTNAKLDEMVVVGYSMGGLIARLQVCESGNEAWKLVSDEPFSDKNFKEGEAMRDIFFFHPNRSIRRVVTIATPFKGSDSVNSFVEWFADKLIVPPAKFTKMSELLNSAHIANGKKNSILSVKNSVESMSPDSPFLEAMNRFSTPEDVVFNNIIGMTETGIVFKKFEGDKVVLYESSHRDDVESEMAVDAYHTFVHTDPVSIRETARILHEHLKLSKTPPRLARGEK